MTETLTEVEELVVPYEDDGKDKLTHIVNHAMNKHIGFPGMKAKEIVEVARISGQEVTALCGYKWVPVHDPEKHDICKACMKVAEEIMRQTGI